LTASDITKLIRIHFAKKGIKLFKNEPHKKYINGKWQVIKSVGYPFGSPDTMGWRIEDGKFCGVEVKTINDRLSKIQKDFLNLIIKDNGLAYVAMEKENDIIHLINWENKEIEDILRNT
jgi:hypothetical protein